QVKGPFRSWRHEHHFRSDGNGNAVLEDRLEYGLPFGPFGRAVAGSRVNAEMDRLFELRHARTRIDLQRFASNRKETPLKIAITGSTGLVGKRLVAFLRSGGHDVRRLVRSEPKASDEIYWSPSTGEIDAESLEGLDAVVHLAGVSISSGLWTAKRKQAILQSRVDGTELLARTLAGLQSPPGVLVTASGVNYYGDTGNYETTESSPGGEGFLADVVRRWEAASEPAKAAGIRVVNARFGVVMAGEGGMLPLIALPFRFGVGGPLGSGKQWMSWVALDDLVGIIHEAIINEELSGPVNATSPEPVTNEEFTKTLGTVLKRPTFLRVPAFAARTVGGQLAEELILISLRVVPARLQETGFQFAFPSLEAALRHELGRYDGHRASEEPAAEDREDIAA
ncbi:MAG: TIGR01777 family oxidoreductase, partial [Chloroflexota bacterium]|nr:TIGR01777 family oxidoreductase [Chloroflexota bacterium]